MHSSRIYANIIHYNRCLQKTCMNSRGLRKRIMYLFLFTVILQSLLFIHHNISNRHIEQRKTNSYAYVSVMCDDFMLDSALVMAASLKNTKTSYSLYIITLPEVTSNARLELLHPKSGIKSLIDLNTLETSHKRLQQDQECSYNKLQLWTLTDYTKIVYLGIDTMIVKNIDELFEKPELSAALDAGGVANTGVFVAEPSLETYKDMLSSYKKVQKYNRSDHGFINWYFTNKAKKGISYLPPEYNLVTWYSDYDAYKEIKSRAKVIHFTAESKPWSFFYMPHKYWERNIDGELFYKWKKIYERVKKDVRGKDAEDLSAYKLNATQGSHRGTAHIQHLASIDTMCDQEWTHQNRIREKFSLLFGTFGEPERVQALVRLLSYYQSSQYLHQIFVIWHNPNVTVPDELKAISVTFNKTLTEDYMKIFIIQTKEDSLNNRFTRPEFLETRAVYIADEDVRIPIADLDTAFRVWRSNTARLVGFFPRAHGQLDQQTFQYIVLPDSRVQKYSLMLTKGMFTDSLFLDMYMCLLPSTIHAYVNLVHNCEDLVYNMMVSGVTGMAPLAIFSLPADFGVSAGLSKDRMHRISRSLCLSDMYQLFHLSMPLLYNDHLIHPYSSKEIRYKRKRFSKWQ